MVFQAENACFQGQTAGNTHAAFSAPGVDLQRVTAKPALLGARNNKGWAAHGADFCRVWLAKVSSVARPSGHRFFF